MSKDIYFRRYSGIIKRLEKSPATFEQIARFLQNMPGMEGEGLTISLRTFQRDINEILELTDIEIVNEKKGDKRYFINSRPDVQSAGERLLEAYGLVNLLNDARQNEQYVFFENRKSVGLEHFGGLLHAIKNRKTVIFDHYKYWEDILTRRTVHPLALKEARGRWYLLAVDKKDGRLKTFGLDRICDVEISKAAFKENYQCDIKALFQHSFGIMYDTAQAPQTIQLLFTYEQGQYVKTYPLHHSQLIVKETDDEVLIELTMVITHDLVMELLSYGEEMRVVAPAPLVAQLKCIYANALDKYS